MNRSIVGIAATMLLLAVALLAFPLWALGVEQFDAEQEAGILFLPFGLMILLVGLTALDPRTTTIGGAFGNAEFDPERPRSPSAPQRTRLAYDPTGDVLCRFCRTVVTADLTQCPRCGRARPCRSCERPLGSVLNRPTCPACARAEVFCNCPPLPRRTAVSAPSSRGRRIA
ncbi:MAG TPA: hypothetical protein VN842_01580 [Thermoplasmata archaeon]|nr:hypothetical protein [Thermoplasmata archaeon]